MSVQTMTATGNDVSRVVAELKSQLGTHEPTAVLFFASAKYDQPALAAAMEAAFEGAKVFGCTSSGEIGGDQMLKGAVVAMAIDATTAPNVAVEVIEDVSGANDVAAAVERLGQGIGGPLGGLDVSRHVGVILIDGMSAAEERVMDLVGNLVDIPVVGASAGDDLAFETTHVFVGGKAHANAAVLAILEVPAGYDILKTQSFRVLDKKLRATQVDEVTRTVIEFDGKPAMVAYAEALGVDTGQAAKLFMNHPLGLMDGDEPYVRSPQRADGDKLVFFCNIKQGTTLSVLESANIVEDTGAALAEQLGPEPSIAGLINFHCILRTLELEKRGQCGAYGALFSGLPSIGFSTYGEQYVGHVNQTSTMLVLHNP